MHKTVFLFEVTTKLEIRGNISGKLKTIRFLIIKTNHRNHIYKSQEIFWKMKILGFEEKFDMSTSQLYAVLEYYQLNNYMQVMSVTLIYIMLK